MLGKLHPSNGIYLVQVSYPTLCRVAPAPKETDIQPRVGSVGAYPGKMHLNDRRRDERTQVIDPESGAKWAHVGQGGFDDR